MRHVRKNNALALLPLFALIYIYQPRITIRALGKCMTMIQHAEACLLRAWVYSLIVLSETQTPDGIGNGNLLETTTLTTWLKELLKCRVREA